MKIRGIEATREEVDGIIRDYGFNYEDFFEIPKTLHTKWLVIPSIAFISLLMAIVLFGGIDAKLLLILFIFAFGFGVWITSSVHLKFNNGVVSFIVSLSLLIILTIGSGYLSPSDAIKVVKDLNE